MLCDKEGEALWRILDPCSEDQEKGNVWSGFKVTYVFKQHEIQLGTLSCRKLYVKYPIVGSLEDTECLYKAVVILSLKHHEFKKSCIFIY